MTSQEYVDEIKEGVPLVLGKGDAPLDLGKPPIKQRPYSTSRNQHHFMA